MKIMASKKSKVEVPSVTIDLTQDDATENNPFLPSEAATGKWSLKTALDHIHKYNVGKGNLIKVSDKINIVSLSEKRAQNLSNEIITSLFRVFSKLKPAVQKELQAFYFDLKHSTPARFHNLTKVIEKQTNVFIKYPWPERNVKDVVLCGKSTDSTGTTTTFVTTLEEKRKEEDDAPKPFSEACNQYEYEVKINEQKSLQNTMDAPPFLPANVFNQNQFEQQRIHMNINNSRSQFNIINQQFNNIHPNHFNSQMHYPQDSTSLVLETNQHLLQSTHSNTQMIPPFNQNAISASSGSNLPDQQLFLAQEYAKMILALDTSKQNKNSDLQESNISKQSQILKVFTRCNEIFTNKIQAPEPPRISKWSSRPPIVLGPKQEPSKTERSVENIINKAQKRAIVEKLLPVDHLQKKKIKLTAQVPLSLADLIILVSFFYKLEYMEQQLLIHQMKILEENKPNEAAYLRQYVRITHPECNENNIKFIPPPSDLFASRNIDPRNITSIDDILEIDFPDDEEQLLTVKRIRRESGDSKNKQEFNFGSEFL